LYSETNITFLIEVMIIASFSTAANPDAKTFSSIHTFALPALTGVFYLRIVYPLSKSQGVTYSENTLAAFINLLSLNVTTINPAAISSSKALKSGFR
jgi:hypothetical protein